MNRKLGPMIAMLAVCVSRFAVAGEALGEAVHGTKYLMNWRVRSELVDQDGIAEDASALTSRLRFGFESGSLARTRLLAEITTTSELSKEFNSTTNGRTAYPVVADPGGFAAVNRFAFINDSLANTTLTIGRQRLVLDDARFVGNVGWRQTEQTYDGVAAHTAREKFSADFAWFNQVNRVFGPNSPNGRWHGDVVLANVSRSFGFGKLTGFAYGLELDEAPAASTDTLGLKLAGSRAFDEISFLYTVAYARQSEAGLNPADVDARYALLEAGVSRGKLSLVLGYELLGGDGTHAFSTPLATLHAFQGWADKFLVTPADGIEDRYLRVGYRPAVTGPFDSISLAAVYHELGADAIPADYGSEIDFSIAGKADKLTLTLKYAAYSAESLLTDTDKLWFSVDFSL